VEGKEEGKRREEGEWKGTGGTPPLSQNLDPPLNNIH